MALGSIRPRAPSCSRLWGHPLGSCLQYGVQPAGNTCLIPSHSHAPLVHQNASASPKAATNPQASTRCPLLKSRNCSNGKRGKKKINLATGGLLLAAREAVSLQPLPAAAPEKTLLQQLLPPSEGQRPHNFQHLHSWFTFRLKQKHRLVLQPDNRGIMQRATSGLCSPTYPPPQPLPY